MTWFRQSSGWRDAESLSAAVVSGAGVLAVLLTRLPAGRAPSCLLKTWTGVPCLTCGATRALGALLKGRVAEAFCLQPLLTLLAIAAVAWVGYAVAGALCGLPRVRVQATRRETILLVVAVAAFALANWVYLVADGR